jgi:predicted N-acetyltransferase YhbS
VILAAVLAVQFSVNARPSRELPTALAFWPAGAMALQMPFLLSYASDWRRWPWWAVAWGAVTLLQVLVIYPFALGVTFSLCRGGSLDAASCSEALLLVSLVPMGLLVGALQWMLLRRPVRRAGWLPLMQLTAMGVVPSLAASCWSTLHMTTILRPARPDDAQACGQICYDGFETIGKQHGFPGDFPSPEVAVEVVGGIIAHPGFYGVVAERDGAVIGSNFMDERCTISGIGPITVDPAIQNSGVGRQLMQHMLDRVASRGAPGVRLLQAAYHARSLTLYAKLGFRVRESMAIMNGPALNLTIPGRAIRLATVDDLDACDAICFAVHGHTRHGELEDGIKNGTALVVEHGSTITGYASSLAFFGHAVGETWDDLKAMIGAVPFIPPPGILAPLRSALFHWGLEHGLRVGVLMNLMSVGLYNDPAGAYLPSVLY